MEFLNTVLPIILYVLGSVLLVILIILGIRLIHTMDRVDRLLDDVEEKVNTLTKFFNIIDTVTDGLTVISDRVIDTVSNLVNKIFRKRKEDVIDE